MTAVAVWDHEPSPEKLLEDRIGRGWRPLPSALATGPEVMGVAACVPRGEWAN